MSVFKFGYSCSNLHSRYYLLLLFFSLTFAHASMAQQSGTAQLTIEGLSNSSATRGKNFAVTYYADEACSRRGKTHKVFEKKYADNVHTFNALAVETDKPFIFQVSYLEKRRGQTRRCSSIANVDLKENGVYKAVFSIVDEVTSCNIKVYDLSPTVIENSRLASSSEKLIQGEANVDMIKQAQQDPTLLSLSLSPQIQIEHKTPDATCAKVGETGYKSGTPVYTYKNRLG